MYFDSFEIEYIPQEVLKEIKEKSINHNTSRMQSCNSIMRGFYCIAFEEYIIAGKALLDYRNLLSPNDYQKNGNIIYKYFEKKYGKRKRKP